MLSQFRRKQDSRVQTLADYLVDMPGFYPAGRLDLDSEGLLLLTNDGQLQNRITDPANKMGKTYRVQVEGSPDETALNALRNGLVLKDGPTRPAKVRRISDSEPWPRDPPVVMHRSLASSWLELEIREGRNRQVRRMLAAVNHPVLRLIRTRIGSWEVGDLKPGEFRELTVNLPARRRISPGARQK